MWFEKTMSDSIKNIAAAQLAVQKEIKDISKDSTGYGYKYTSFDKLVQYLRPLLAKHGISFVQMPVGDKYDDGSYGFFDKSDKEAVGDLRKLYPEFVFKQKFVGDNVKIIFSKTKNMIY